MDARQLYEQNRRLQAENQSLRARIGTLERKLSAAAGEVADLTQALHDCKDQINQVRWTTYLAATAQPAVQPITTTTPSSEGEKA